MLEFYKLNMQFATELLILGFLSITFLQSAYDKLTDWKGNVNYIKSVFEKTKIYKLSTLMLGIVTFGEVIGGLACFIGLFEVYFYHTTHIGLFGAVMCAKVLLALLFGQRVVKDYAGAMTIAVYFMVAIFGVYILGN